VYNYHEGTSMMDFKTLYSKTKDLSLLIVEDYEPLRNDMAEALEDLFKTVVVASNGVEALGVYDEYKATNSKAFDIVISDIEMPLMNGVELSEMLRERHEQQQIIILSAHTDSEYLLKLINLGIAQFINKPIQHDRLLDTLYYVSGKVDHKEEIFVENPIVDLGDNTVWNKERGVLLRERYPIALTRHEIILMKLLVDQAEQICSNDAMLHHFYIQGIDLDEKNIRNLVFKLRKKLPSRAIESIYGMGYKLVPVR